MKTLLGSKSTCWLFGEVKRTEIKKKTFDWVQLERKSDFNMEQKQRRASNSPYKFVPPQNSSTRTTNTPSTVSHPAAQRDKQKKDTTAERFPKTTETFVKGSFNPIEIESFIDTHCHLDMILNNGMKTFDELDDIRTNFFGSKFDGCVNVCCFPDGFDYCVQLQARFPYVFGAYGVHPHSANLWNSSVESKLIEQMKHPKSVAWGECGLDFFKNKSPKQIQMQVFERQCELAVTKFNKFSIASNHLSFFPPITISYFTPTTTYKRRHPPLLRISHPSYPKHTSKPPPDYSSHSFLIQF